MAPRPARAADVTVYNSGELAGAVKTSGTVTLGRDITLSDSLLVDEGAEISLDLGGHTLTFSAGGLGVPTQVNGTPYYPAIVNNGSLRIDNGKFEVQGSNDGILNQGSVILGEGVELNAPSSLQKPPLSNRIGTYLLVNNSGSVLSSGTLTSLHNHGIVTFGGSVEVSGGSISAEGSECAAIDIFSSDYTSSGNGAQVTISGGTITSGIVAASTNNVRSANSSLTITGGTISTGSTSIYWPTSGTLTIGDAATGTGPAITSQKGSAIEICSGTLNVYGGTLVGGAGQTTSDSIGTEELQAFLVGQATSGYVGAGDAITVFANRAEAYAASPLDVNITGGVFSSAENYGVRMFDNNSFAGTQQGTQDVALSISGGSFTGGLGAVDAEYLQPANKRLISGGTFSDNTALKYLAEGCSAEVTSDGSFLISEGGAFEVEDKQYVTLAEAVDAADNGGTITMLKSTVSDPVTIDKGVTLDLGGNTLLLAGTGTQDEVGLRFTGGSSALKNGAIYDGRAARRTFSVVVDGQGTSLVMEDVALTVEVPQSGDTYAVRVLDGADLTLNDGASIREQKVDGRSGYTYGVTVYGSSSEATIDPSTASTLTVNEGASVESYAFAVSGNGDGTKHNTIVTVNGGTLTSEAGPVIYNPQYGRVVINGGTLDGCSGVEIRAGELEVSGGTIKGDTEKTVVYPKESIGGSNSVDGGGIVVAQHSTKLPVKVTVSGGTVEANTAFIQHNVMGNDQASIDKIEMSLTGGTFTGSLRADNFADEDGKGFISGGVFSSEKVGEFLVPHVAVAAGEGGSFAVYPTEEEALANGGAYLVRDEQGNAWIFSSEKAAGDFASSQGGDVKVEAVRWTVVFDGGSGSSSDVSVLNGERVARPADPVRAGYTFAGWKTSDGKAYDFDAPVTGPLTISSSWTLNVPTVSVGADNAKPLQGETVRLIASVELAADSGITSAYQWLLNGEPIAGATESTLSVSEPGTYSVRVSIADNDGLTASATSDALELSFAPAPVASHTVTFVYGGGLDDKVVVVEDGQTVDRPADPTLDGWTFVGWFATRGSDNALSDEYDFSTPVTSDVTLYAGWVRSGEQGQGQGQEQDQKPVQPGNDTDTSEKLADTGDAAVVVPVLASIATGASALGAAVFLRRRSK